MVQRVSSLVSLLLRAMTHHEALSSCNTKYFPDAPFPNTTHWGWGLQHVIFGWHTHLVCNTFHKSLITHRYYMKIPIYSHININNLFSNINFLPALKFLILLPPHGSSALACLGHIQFSHHVFKSMKTVWWTLLLHTITGAIFIPLKTVRWKQHPILPGTPFYGTVLVLRNWLKLMWTQIRLKAPSTKPDFTIPLCGMWPVKSLQNYTRK